jgi:hypothetical protein
LSQRDEGDNAANRRWREQCRISRRLYQKIGRIASEIAAH